LHKLTILGAGGHGRVLADAALRAGWEAVEFFDDRWPDVRQAGPWSITGPINLVLSEPDRVEAAIVGIGNNRVRLRLFDACVNANLTLTSVIHPSACISDFASIGSGSAILAGSVVGPFATVGEAAIVNHGAIVEHDCRLARGVHICPQAALGGEVDVAEGAWIGIGAVLRNRVSVGIDAVVGAGAVVVADVPDYLTVVGSPARPTQPRGIR